MMETFQLKREPAKGRKRFVVETIQAHERTRQGVLFVGANDKKGQGYMFSDETCDCEKPGFFHSGVPGVIAAVRNGKLMLGASVERCDLCCRFSTDEDAGRELVRLGVIEAEAKGGA